jgi:succinate dehydrogenase / fumarate reductase cytochrome b subunit
MNQRPLSPHLQVYRLPLTAVMSITHRLTGVALIFGVVVWVVFLMVVSQGDEASASAFALVHGGLGRLFLLAWTFALFFHACHGFRHLIWDTGNGLEKPNQARHSWIELVLAVILTGLSLVVS